MATKPPTVPTDPDYARSSGIEKKMRALRTRHAKPPAVGTHRPLQSRGAQKLLTLDHALEMVSDLAQDFYTRAKNPAITEFNRKQLATAFAILMDKFTILSGRPTQIHTFTSAQETRQGLLDLGKVIALKIAQNQAEQASENATADPAA